MIFFFNDTATTEIYTLSLHDALPIFIAMPARTRGRVELEQRIGHFHARQRSEEHTSELQSRVDLVCRLLLEKKKVAQSPGLLNLEVHEKSEQRFIDDHAATHRERSND